MMKSNQKYFFTKYRKITKYQTNLKEHPIQCHHLDAHLNLKECKSTPTFSYVQASVSQYFISPMCRSLYNTITCHLISRNYKFWILNSKQIGNICFGFAWKFPDFLMLENLKIIAVFCNCWSFKIMDTNEKKKYILGFFISMIPWTIFISIIKQSWKWLAGSLFIHVVDRLLRLWRRLKECELVEMKQLDSDVVQLVFKKKGFKAKPGQVI